MSFGGSVKLTGESEYRQAIKNCISSLQTMSTTLKSQTADFNNNDKSIKNSAAAQKQLTETIKSQQAELSKARSQYASYQVALTAQTTKHNALNKEYKTAVTELDRIRKASGENSIEYQKQAQVVDKLEKELIDSTEAMNESKTAMSALKSEMNNSQKTINNAEKALNDLGNEAEDSGKQAEKSSEGFTVLKGVLANLVTQGITAAINGAKKLSTTLVNVGKQAISSYAEYEQLVGGVETLFKDSADIVQKNAEIAYRTAGISANKYMEQATSFSASLLQGLGGDTKKAAEIADMAIIDMSDNANKMGTSIQMIQNAYQGFAKDNFTMLDNLKLGYGGTAGEMARLINETGVMGEAFKATAQNVKDVPFDKMIEAIHEVQVQMGITGTTSKEAADTIQGSAGSMKASWENLLTAIADENQDLSKRIDEFVNSVIVTSKNLVPRIKQVVEGIKKLIHSLINDVFPKLKKEIPQLRPLIETFEWFIDHKSLVVGAVQAMVAAFAVNKILTFTKGMSDVAKSILTVATTTTTATTATNLNTTAQVANTTAQASGTIVTKGLTAATNLLNAAWKANPIGLVVTAVMALVAVYQTVKGKSEELTEAEKQQQEEIDNLVDKINQEQEAWDNLKKAKQDQINAGMTELNHYETLYDELQNIVDANGKVKEGYEDRASFIVSTLNEALGTEISMTDGVIKNYGKLKDTIQEVMEKKKAQIILESQEELYAEAIKNKTQATKDLAQAQDALNKYKQENAWINGEVIKKEQALEDAIKHGGVAAAAVASKQLEDAKKKQQAYNDEVNTLHNAVNQQENRLNEYYYNIGLYEQNAAAAHAGNYEQMSQVTWDYVKDFQGADEAQRLILEEQIKDTEVELERLRKLKEKSGSDLYDQQIKDGEKLLEKNREQLKAYTSATEDALYDNQKSWLENASNVITKLTGKKTEFRDVGNGQVQWYEDGMAIGAPMAQSEAETIAKDTLEEFDKKLEAEGAGKDLLQGFINGESNSYIQASAFKVARTFAGSILSNLKSKLGIASPSKETKKMGMFLLQGLGIGMENEENSVLKQATDFGKSVIDSLNDGLSENVNMSAISDIKNNIPGNYSINGRRIMNGSTPTDTQNNIVEAFKEALSQMKIELDDENMGKFVEDTVANAIYS